jgi:hypothetical protein
MKKEFYEKVAAAFDATKAQDSDYWVLLPYAAKGVSYLEVYGVEAVDSQLRAYAIPHSFFSKNPELHRKVFELTPRKSVELMRNILLG